MKSIVAIIRQEKYADVIRTRQIRIIATRHTAFFENIRFICCFSSFHAKIMIGDKNECNSLNRQIYDAIGSAITFKLA